MIAGDVLRGRSRKGFEKPQPGAPNEVNEYLIPLHGSDHTFRRGHKIMVQVQSSWFPVIDRNPQKYVENIFTAQENDFHVATQRVYRSQKFASCVEVPVVRE